MKLIVVTSNVHKAGEVAAFFSGIAEVEHVSLEIPEYRFPKVREIAEEKARYAYRTLQRPLIVDDTGFFIDALNGFPGPNAAYVFETIGNRGILKLMAGVTDRRAHFETVIAYASAEGVKSFPGIIEGTVVSPRGRDGFGYDPIFLYEGRTLAEIPLNEKSMISHRARALDAFRTWIIRTEEPAGD
ncbi:RdgB/HAM1 family non-canonical purine NTP pyrophosphatase [Methanosphaerula palustris]|uniref:Non-canonical purine NTP pyrophosphatase, rdgB/HAM1 family n=1 Tax=Methanosphaerula palustris (strain ATCC BAA-1556 / DSM 19958 / E1-9c) TaxID=521011 RepID=B8GFC0_METPE|nr:RdgB/HAM1 family non-canonical purine NTP pyrophosphatase [Methanosphaerula palustris]ACL15968.1 non-canonical purine NTP pyrophosphatase, rdgB/HAM1 family [Methanosphaerula palustris E1-9c]